MAKNLGRVTAYAHAKAGGYTGTQDEFNAMLAGLDEYNEAAAQSAEEASGYAEEASGYVTEASGYADNASESASAALEILGRLHGSERARYWKHYDVTTQTTDFAFNPTNYSYTTGDDYDVYVNGEMLDRNKVMIHTTSYEGGYNVAIIIDGGISGAGNPDKVDIFCYKDITLSTDDTLTEQGAAADAKATGDAIDELKDDLNDLEEQIEQVSGLSDDAKIALLACFAHVGWKEGDGQEYYDALEAALYASDYPLITATFTPGSHVVYTDDDLNTLKPYLIVKLFEDEQDTGQVIPASAYILSGILQEGQSTISVKYNNLYTSFTVTAVDFYNISNWSYPNGGLLKRTGASQQYITSNAKVPSMDNNTNRRSFYVNHGKIPFVNDSGSPISGVYPIPVPDGATSITGTITPSTQFFNIRPFRYTEENGYNAMDGETGWKQGTGTFSNLASGVKYFFIINCKYNSAGSSYPTEPTGFEVTFGFNE